MTLAPDRYAVFGNPISHSKSPLLQMEFAKQTQENMVYTAECVAENNFILAANHFFSGGGKGLNVTVPFKLDAYNYAQKLTERARLAGAVNTLINKEGIIIGDNTDGIGFVNDVLNNLQWTLNNKRVLILGAGGAVRGIIQPLLDTGVRSITIANRTVEKAQAIADIFPKKYSIDACHYSELNHSFDLVVNGTSASLSGKLPEINASIINKNTCCYDMMYEKEDTIFMKWAKEWGANNISDGLGMLVCQGAESFYQWRGIRPETKKVVRFLREIL